MAPKPTVKVYRKSREELKNYPDGLMVVCPSKPSKKIKHKKIIWRGYYGEDFLLEFGAWGFVNLSKDPDYFALYVSLPISAVKYFGVVDEILDPREEEHPVKDFRKYESYEEGDKLIMLKKDMIIELDDMIPYKETLIPGFRYTTLNKFIEAETTDDLLD